MFIIERALWPCSAGAERKRAESLHEVCAQIRRCWLFGVTPCPARMRQEGKYRLASPKPGTNGVRRSAGRDPSHRGGSTRTNDSPSCRTAADATTSKNETEEAAEEFQHGEEVESSSDCTFVEPERPEYSNHCKRSPEESGGHGSHRSCNT